MKEVIFVENGSSDRTYEVCRRLAREFPGTVVVERIGQASYGEAVKKGIERARGEVVCVLECDFLEPSFLDSSLALIEEGQADFVVGSKRAAGARDLRPWKRRALTALFNAGLKLFFRFPGTDTHGLKAIRTEEAKRICAASQTGGEVFQTELVLLAHRFGYRVAEIPVTVRERRPTKVFVRRRLAKVVKIVWELRRSLRRFKNMKGEAAHRPIFQSLFSGRAAVIGLLILTVLFQAAVLTKARFLYRLAEGVFFILLAVLLGSLVRLLARRKGLILVLLFILLLRIPFYHVPEGMITTSDNAIEALQGQEMKITKTAPFFLLESISHIGTFKYMCISFLWDVTGSRYLLYLLVQLAFFLALLYLLARFLEPYAPPPVIFLLVFFHFAFIEQAFDYSLSIRGGTYLEMLVFILLGAALFDFEYKQAWRIVAASFFLGFAVYIHQLAVIFVLAFILTALLLSLAARRFFRGLALMTAGLLLGTAHWLYYLLFFKAKPVIEGGWENFSLIGLRQVNLSLLPKMFNSLKTVFWNLFQYEFSWGLESLFRERIPSALRGINQAALGISLAVFLAGLGLVVARLIRLLRKKDRFDSRSWLPVFFIFLLLGFLAKQALLLNPRLEPRHNFEILLLVMISYALVLSAAWKLMRNPLRAVAAVLLAVFFLASILPHGAFFWKQASRKQQAYTELTAALRAEKVRYLATDFNIAYTVYFLSGRTVKVSSSFGPLGIDIFYRPMSQEVDKVPRRRKAFLFYAEDNPVPDWYQEVSRSKKNILLDNLRKTGIPYKVIELEDYTLVVPQPRY